MLLDSFGGKKKAVRLRSRSFDVVAITAPPAQPVTTSKSQPCMVCCAKYYYNGGKGRKGKGGSGGQDVVSPEETLSSYSHLAFLF